MSKIVFFSIPLFGHVNYGLTLAKELKKQGHSVIYYSGMDFKDFIEDSGIEFYNYSDEIEYLFSDKKSSYNNSYVRNLNFQKMDYLSEWYLFCSHLYKITDIFMNTDILTMDKPDLIIYDSAALWGQRIAEYFNVKCIASCTPYTYPIKYAETNLSQFVRLIFKKDLSNSISKRTIHIMNVNLRNSFKELSNCSVFEPLFPLTENKIIYTAECFQMGAEYLSNENCCFCGTITRPHKPRYEFSKLLSNEKKNIYIAFGSIYNNMDYLKEIYNSCKHLNYRFILNIGKNNSISEIPSNDNWKIINEVDQINLLNHIDIFITHGGVNSVREAATSGVPMIVIPFEGDTRCTAFDVSRLNIGKVVELEEINNLPTEIEALVNDKKIAENSLRLSKNMREKKGLKVIIKYINEIGGF